MRVRLNSTLRGATGRHGVELDLPDGATVRQALDVLVSQVPTCFPLLFDAQGDLQSNIVIFRNGRNIQFSDGLNTPLYSDQTLDIFPRTGVQRALAKD